MKRKYTAILLVLCMVLSMYSTAFAVVGVDPPKDSDTFVITSIDPSLISPGPQLISEPALDYSDAANWAYFEEGKERPVDLFLICPTVDTRSETNSFDLNDKLRGRFVNALDMERGIYEDSARMFSPYYRQMSMNAYRLDGDQQAQARAVAYNDISAAFRWYLDNENDGRGLILAGFSQGSDMCLELLKEYFGGDVAEAKALREKLIAVYSIGWSVTEEMAAAYPQIVPAKGETDTGVVISFDCEDGSLDGTLVNPAGTKALSINPLNWKTDGTKADKALNKGAVMSTGAEPQPELCGAYIGSRGELVVTDVTAADYPAAIDIFPEGSYHVYDYMFFFENLRENVAARTAAWRAEHPFRDVADDLWYSDAVKFAYEKGLMDGTSTGIFNPDKKFTRAQLAAVLWRFAGEPVVNYAIPYSDVPQELWYSEAVRWAAAEKITDKSSGAFGPNEPISREETAEMFFRMARHQGLDLSIDDGRASFADEAQISDRYRAAINWAVFTGLMEGSSGKLNPKGELSRAQAAMLLQRFCGIIRAQSPLSLWTDDARAASELMAYIDAVTEEGGRDFIPEADRIAVFDLDGTLFCETDPNYFDYTLLKYRVLEDPSYKDKASDFEKEVANKIKEQNETGKSFSGLEVDHGKAVASAFAGLTVEEFNDYIQEFKKQAMPSYTGMLRGEGWYRPMLQVVELLKENGFTVYVVSGTDRLIVRGIAYDSPLGLPNRQIIGSDETIVSSAQGEEDGLNYVFKDGEQLVLGGDFIIKNLKMNKVSVIMQEIGQQPVLSFGNSTGDSSMAEFVTYNNKYRSLAFMLCCDDLERENGSQSKADKMYQLCEEFDWVPVSMKNDWVTIYGDGVTYTGGK